MLKICIWMNIPSHYQSAFFQALEDRRELDLKVVYLHGASSDRAAEGWDGAHVYAPYEVDAEGAGLPEHLDRLLPDWRERIHLISAHFHAPMIAHFCREGVEWCHWSEMPGIRLAELLGYRMALFRGLNSLMWMCKRAEGRVIRNQALGAFGQGILARRAFRIMGVPDEMISDLYYAPNGLPSTPGVPEILEFSKGRKVVLAVGALCPRKGIDLLLRAFARVSNPDGCLVLCGLDRGGGRYQALARKLGLDGRVLFLGTHPAERIAEVYAAADLFVLASRFDGWGAVLNEAASVGLPMIGTDLCGAAWHVIEDGKNGYRVHAGQVDPLARALARYAEHPEWLAVHGAVARNRFEKQFTPAVNADRLEAALVAWRQR